MKPRGPLMIEHRLIERMLELVREEIRQIEVRNAADPVFIDAAVDFMRFYADRTHHGKEEDILFRVLAAKKMSPADTNIMNELIEEHKYGRQQVKELVDAKQAYLQGDRDSLKTIAEQFTALVQFYPKHITKEDQVFFPASEAYLSPEEQEAMLQEFWEFDKKMIHEKYRSVVEQLEQGKG
jgi:hemerythrin-like domain-containing protein